MCAVMQSFNVLLIQPQRSKTWPAGKLWRWCALTHALYFLCFLGCLLLMSTPVIHCNWTAQQASHRWVDEKGVWAFTGSDDLDRCLMRSRFRGLSIVYEHVLNVCLMEPALTPQDVKSGLTFTDHSSVFMMATVVLTPAQVEAQRQLPFIAATFHIV